MTFATRQRLLLGLAVLMMLVPTFLYAAGMLGRAPMYDGDVRKEMTCLTCNGVGRTGKEETCPTCHGRGVAEFIIPGDDRPLQLVGTILDPKGKKVQGATIGVREQGQKKDDAIYFTSNPDGQFGVKVPPGDWLFEISADSGSVNETVEVKPDHDPISARSSDTFHKLEHEFHLSTR